MTSFSVRLAESSDFMELLSTVPDEDYTAWTVMDGNEVAGIAGVTYEDQGLLFFSDINKTKQYPKMTIFRYGAYIVEQIAKLKQPTFAAGTIDSDRFLQALGFIYVCDYNGYRMYELWQN